MRLGSGLVFCFLPLLIQTSFILMHYIACDPALFINGKSSVAESHTEDSKYLCRFDPRNEILKRLYEIFETGKKQDLTPWFYNLIVFAGCLSFAFFCFKRKKDKRRGYESCQKRHSQDNGIHLFCNSVE